jgi:predicted peptidase
MPNFIQASTTSAKSVLFTFLLIMTLFPMYSWSQEVIYFKEGLTLDAGTKYGREAVYTDPLAYQLYTKTLATPKDGALFGKDVKGADLSWKKIEADTGHRFLRTFRSAANYVYLTYTSTEEKISILNISGNSTVYINGVLHAGDPYALGWMNVPIQLKKGLNEFYVRGQGIKASLTFPEKSVLLNVDDATLPFIVQGKTGNILKGAVIVINASSKSLNNLTIVSKGSGKEIKSVLPDIPAFSSRKVAFSFNTENATSKGLYDYALSLIQNGKVVDRKSIKIESVKASDKYNTTFVSNIDGSLQYYSVAPKTGSTEPGAALFLSVHGAGVEAINQARAYQSKDWGNIVTATNRRPRGFNWEDWGRLDALEVLALAKKEFKPDPQRIYLTGHSMGGHGTWFLGATYPDKWAAIAPCSGYPTMKGYGSADGLIPDSSSSLIGQTLLRASNQSDVPKLALNYKQLGIYVLHGDSDRTVSVDYARQMKRQLATFHPDFAYYEYPGGEHWFGDQSVDWKPLFDYFKYHTLKLDSSVNRIDFTTASPGISSSNHWTAIYQQNIPLAYSRIVLVRNLKAGTVTGKTENIHLLKIKLADFGANVPVSITLDSLNTIKYTTKMASDSLFLQNNGSTWAIVNAPGSMVKGPHRYGTFKEGFNKNMVFVYGTTGNAEENEWSLNKARFDSESWYYRGNGAVDIISDKQYSKSKYAGRNVVLFGNSSSNSAWKVLLNDCPVQVSREKVSVGTKDFKGDDLGAYFVWPIKGTTANSVSVISGSGIKGLKAVNANQYYAGGSGFPDIMIYRLNMLTDGVSAVEYSGFYENNWKLKE